MEKILNFLVNLQALIRSSWLEGFKSTRSFWVLAFMVAAVAAGLTRQHSTNLSDAALIKQNSKHKHPTMVVLAPARSSDVPVYLTALGSVTPLYSVTVKTQASGQLIKVLFREGQMVKAGDLLMEIDDRPYVAQLTQFEGQLARDQAFLANARLDLKRYETLAKQDAVTKQTLDTQIWLVKQYEGIVKSDQGQVENAKVNLSYCRILSPVDGRIGLRLVDPGNFVQPTDLNGLVIINTLQPITVVFSIPEDNVPQVMNLIKDGKKLPVEAYDRAQSKLLTTGELLTVDNQIDSTTGMVKLKAQFQNDDYSLFPNQFVNIRLLVNVLHNATIIPTAAIQYGTNGPFVFLKQDNNNTVNIKPISVGVTVGDNTVITEGILPGQLVVTEGSDKLTDGSAIATSQKSFLKKKTEKTNHTRGTV